jgi:hypothetical protein
LLALLAACVWPARAHAQPPTRRDTTVRVPIPARPDSARIDSVRGVPDTLPAKPRADSIQPQLARGELPPADPRVGTPLRWTRDSAFNAGALTVGDLLERVAGVTTYRTGWLATAHTAAYLGDFRRVRLFRDGVEVDPVDPRNGGVHDLLDLQLWQADDVVIERTASEVRVHVRTWTTRNTNAYTRVDIATGDEDTNLYRGLYGKRWGNGVALQVGAQQLGTGTRNRLGGGGDATNALLRLGWARGRWSVDGTYIRLDRARDVTVDVDGDSILAGVELRRNESYVRVAYGDPDRGGLWAQAIANSLRLSLDGTGPARVDTALVFSRTPTGRAVTRTIQGIDSVPGVDSASARAQYVLAGGYTFGALRLSATDRVRSISGSLHNTPSARLSYERGWLAVTAFGEWGGVGGVRIDRDSVTVRRRFPLIEVDTTQREPTVQVRTTERDTIVELEDRQLRNVVVNPDRWSRLDLTARVSPLSWLALQGAVSRDTRETFVTEVVDTSTTQTSTFAFTSVTRPAVTTARLDAAVRLGRTWVSGGVIRRSASELVAPIVYGFGAAPEGTEPGVTGVVVSAQGRFYKDAYVDVNAVAWDGSALYRPQYQARAEVGIATNWITRFPSGNLGIRAALIDEYRSRTPFVLPPPGEQEGAATLNELCALADSRCAPPSNTLTVLLEIRIQRGSLWYQLRNALNRRYEQVPGFVMPRPINVYGVRWDFWG